MQEEKVSRYYTVEHVETDGWQVYVEVAVMDRETESTAEVFIGRNAKQKAEEWIKKRTGSV